MISPSSIRAFGPLLAAAFASLCLGGAAAAAPKGAPEATPTPLPYDPGPALDAGLSFLRDGIDDEPAALGFAWFLHRRFGVGQFADAPDRYDAALAKTATKDSPEKGAVRLFRRMVAVDNAFDEGDVEDLSADWDRVGIRALYCDRVPLPDDYGASLKAEAEKGGYHLTHAGMSLMWLRDNGCPWPVDEVTASAWADAMVAHITSNPPGDVSYEAAGVLRYLGYGDRVPAGFGERIVEAQNDDGGWAFDPDRPESHWHPTLLALWAILEEVASAKLDAAVPQAGGPVPPPTPSPVSRSAEAPPPAWTEMVESEDRILALAPHLGPLANALRNLDFPGTRMRSVFADEVSVTDVGTPPNATPFVSSVSARQRPFPVAEERSVARDDLVLWKPLVDEVVRFDNAGFHMVRGGFVDGDRGRFETEVSFDARALLRSGDTAWIRALLSLIWQKEDGKGEAWKIATWRTRSLELVEAPGIFFEEILPTALRDDRLLAEARHSGHDDLVRQYLADPDRKGSDFFPPAMDEHPGLAVVDLDRDGFDDLYVMPHWGPNRMLRNRGDGTFEEITSEVGLDVDGHTAAAVFADFDNDGDADAMLARTDRPSLYLRNDDGRFHDASESIQGGLPALASSVTAADVDADGLLDVYFATYAVHRLTGDYFGKERSPDEPLLEGFLSAESSKALRAELERRAEVYDFPGPPNVLLRNVGNGGFRVEADSPLATFANTYQATWADYDDDGDADVYLANDFAPNHLFRNDGKGRFEDVTEETGTSDVGFGMGATWGDVDGDGLEDLYVSNMFSKAGTRITALFEGIDSRVPKMARGNTLFHNEKERFRDLSGEPGSHRGQKAGWSWGGQFIDADNDAVLDLYVLSGYYTAPREFELPVDT